MVSCTMTTVPLPIPYKIRPQIIMYKLFVDADKATRMLPDVINNVVINAPGIVPNASIKIPPITGKTVLTIATLD